jgi:hypothetical protein
MLDSSPLVQKLTPSQPHLDRTNRKLAMTFASKLILALALGTSSVSAQLVSISHLTPFQIFSNLDKLNGQDNFRTKRSFGNGP